MPRSIASHGKAQDTLRMHWNRVPNPKPACNCTAEPRHWRSSVLWYSIADPRLRMHWLVLKLYLALPKVYCLGMLVCLSYAHTSIQPHHAYKNAGTARLSMLLAKPNTTSYIQLDTRKAMMASSVGHVVAAWALPIELKLRQSQDKLRWY